MPNLSQYQLDILEWVRTGSGSAVVEAVAGSGKTFTLLKALNEMDSMASVKMLAFNKAIADTLAGQVPPNISVSTINAFGHGIVKKSMPRIKFDRWKTYTHLLKSIKNPAQARKASHAVGQAISLCKSSYDGKYFANMGQLIEKNEIYFPKEVGNPAELCIEVLAACINDTHSMDFDDQVLFPLYHSLPITKYEWVCIDEAQDLNALQQALVKKMVNDRLLAVGDPNQSIYKFRGAISLYSLADHFKAKRLPLSVCYRCAKAITREAKSINLIIEEHDQAEEGLVETVKLENWRPRVGELVLCRTNTPLIRECLNEVAKGGKAYIAGRELADTLLTIYKETNKLANIKAYRAKFEEKAYLTDCLDALELLQSTIKYPKTVEDTISSLFKESSHSVIFSTIHKAKGKEADYVSIIRPDLLPHPKGDPDEERNLKYVAVTRAKKKLTWVTGER
jgi:DNA helicase-2/ATP-dependent DNA helicase PcrA